MSSRFGTWSWQSRRVLFSLLDALAARLCRHGTPSKDCEARRSLRTAFPLPSGFSIFSTVPSVRFFCSQLGCLNPDRPEAPEEAGVSVEAQLFISSEAPTLGDQPVGADWSFKKITGK